MTTILFATWRVPCPGSRVMVWTDDDVRAFATGLSRISTRIWVVER
jgi:hypothetical protein